MMRNKIQRSVFNSEVERIYYSILSLHHEKDIMRTKPGPLLKTDADFSWGTSHPYALLLFTCSSRFNLKTEPVFTHIGRSVIFLLEVQKVIIYIYIKKKKKYKKRKGINVKQFEFQPNSPV